MSSPYLESVFQVFRTTPTITVSEWAERYREIPRGTADEPGPWRNSRTPYLVEIMDELSARSRTKEVVFCKGSQIGATEAGVNWLLYLIDCVPGPIMALQPTDGEAATWSKQRVAPSIERCRRIREKVTESKSRDSGNTILEKEFDGGYLFLRGTNTPNALSGLPIGNLYFDEVDRYPRNVGKEGDPIKLALRRITNFPRAKAFFSSTPTLKTTTRIWRMYEDSDRRVYEVPCPYCGHYQTIEFDRFHWTKGDYSEVYLTCSGCSSLIAEHHKTTMLAKGKWRATNPGHKRAGFHLSSLYSPLGWYSWAQAAEDFDKAEGDEEAMIAFVNTVLGLPWEETAEQIADEYLRRRVETYSAQVPEGVLMLTMQVDVQKNRLEYEVVGWGRGEESWGIEYRAIPGDPSILDTFDESNPSVWSILDGYRRAKYLRGDGTELSIACTVVDSGGSCTDTVYQYTRERQQDETGERKSEWVFAVKGGSQQERPILNRPTRVGRHKALLFTLGVFKGKDHIIRNLKREKPGPGYCHFPSDENTGYDSKYYAGLICERKVVTVVNGRTKVEWRKPRGTHNEPFDLRVYGLAAIRIRNPNWDQLEKERDAARKSGAATRQVRTGSPVRRRRGGMAGLGGIRLAGM